MDSRLWCKYLLCKYGRRYFSDRLGYNRPRPSDDALPDAYGAHLGIDVYSTAANPNKVMSTGGNWMSDGAGIAFSSELLLDENDGTGDYGSLSYPNHTEAELDAIFRAGWGLMSTSK